MVEQLGYIEQPAAIGLFKAIHTSPWKKKYLLPRTSLCKVQADVNEWTTQRSYSPLSIIHSPLSFDVIYFDAFAPEKQPEMWSQELFNRLYVLLNEGGILTTYCAKGVIRRMLQAAGFTVERLPGPPGGKGNTTCPKTGTESTPILIQ